jgi:hypothetical protein
MYVTVAFAQMMKRDDRVIHLNLYCGGDLNLQPWLIGNRLFVMKVNPLYEFDACPGAWLPWPVFFP